MYPKLEKKASEIDEDYEYSKDEDGDYFKEKEHTTDVGELLILVI